MVLERLVLCRPCIYNGSDYFNKKRVQWQTFILFIDCEKFLDSSDRNKLWQIMFNRKFPQHALS
jgi:hypothetical protein